MRLIKTKMPSTIMKQSDRTLGAGVAMILVSPFALVTHHTPYVMIMFLTLGILVITHALCTKVRIVKTGYEEHVFRVYDYTYISRSMRAPSGMLMRSADGKSYAKYHLAVNGEYGLPEIGSVIRVYVPKSSKTEAYGDRNFFPVVLGYEKVE